jgi:hypothetical protein
MKSKRSSKSPPRNSAPPTAVPPATPPLTFVPATTTIKTPVVEPESLALPTPEKSTGYPNQK